MEDGKNNLSEFMGKPYAPLEKPVKQTPKLIEKKAEYKAFEEFKSKKFLRFRIVDADGKSYGCTYAHLIDWVFTPSTLLTITTATRIFTLQGKHLGRIERLLLEDKIKELHVFSDKKHEAISNPNAAIIEKLEITET